MVDVLNMSTEVLKNQLIEFPQFQSSNQNENNNNNNNNTNTPATFDSNQIRNIEINDSNDTNISQKNDGDRRSSMDLPAEEAIRIAAETARALEPLKMMSDIRIGKFIIIILNFLLFISPSQINCKINSCRT